MTDSQIAWAARHDWFVTADAFLNGVWVEDATRAQDGTFTVFPRHFTSFADLRAWAGY